MTPEAVQVAAAFSALRGEDVLWVERLSGGSSHPSWRVTTATGVYAVRLYTTNHSAYSQTQLLTYLMQQGVPVPKVAFVGTYRAQHLLALGWVEGLTVAEALRTQPDRAEQLGEVFGEMHAQLHAVPVTPEMRAALRVVSAPGQAAGTPVLVHLDYHLLNVMTDGSIITGVIDWENVRLGDARYDVARTLSILCADPSIRALPQALRQVVRTFRQGYLEGYRHAARPASLTTLPQFLAWSRNFMLRDLGGRLDSQQATSIERWSRWWQHQSG
jgi:aminoglycoside phosphotransferase (APT) family kinase protein